MPRAGPSGGDAAPQYPLMPRNSNGKRPIPSRSSVSVIELSSEDESSRRSPVKPPPKKRKAVTPIPPIEIVEISSDEDGPPPPAKPTIPDEIRKQLAQLPKLQKENAKLKKEQATSLKEIAELKARNSRAAVQLNVDDLEDNVSCEICTVKMWAPYMLECGHTFCSQCLQDWFKNRLDDHKRRHPNYGVNNPAIAQINAIMHTYRHHPNMLNQLMAQYQHVLPPDPEYTCPTCRASIKRKPIEAFALKEIVRKVAAAQGESSPRKPPHPPPATVRRGKSRAAAPPKRVDPFAQFF